MMPNENRNIQVNLPVNKKVKHDYAYLTTCFLSLAFVASPIERRLQFYRAHFSFLE